MSCLGLSSRCVNHSISRSTSRHLQSVARFANLALNQSTTLTLNKSINRTRHQSINQSTNQPISRCYHSSSALRHGGHHPVKRTRRSYSEKEQEIMSILSKIPEPQSINQDGQSVNQSTNQDIVYAGHVVNVSVIDDDVSIILALNDQYRSVRRLVQSSVDQSTIPWVKSVRVTMDDGKPISQSSNQAINPALNQSSSDSVPFSLRQVKRIIAVSSCKGGVGKSTVAVNLAYSISQSIDQSTNRPFKVGILDADIFGPSLPTLVGRGEFASKGCVEIDGLIEPLSYEGVKSMSYGYLENSQSKGSILRGPLASLAIKDLITRTNWGELDFLIVDFPPGTGDIALTLIQSVNFDGAIVVTTPNLLAHVDVKKGITMFEKVNVPVKSLVENLAYYVCDHCDTKHRIFGEGHINQLLIDLPHISSESVYHVPIIHSINQSSERGDPFVLTPKRSDPREQAVIDVYAKLAKDTITESINQPAYHLSAQYDVNQSIVQVQTGDDTKLSINPSLLRSRCRCAGCVDELTGKSRLKPNQSTNQSVKPIGLRIRGRYAVAVHWSDGHATSLYTVEQLKEAAQLSNIR